MPNAINGAGPAQTPHLLAAAAAADMVEVKSMPRARQQQPCRQPGWARQAHAALPRLSMLPRLHAALSRHSVGVLGAAAEQSSSTVSSEIAVEICQEWRA